MTSVVDLYCKVRTVTLKDRQQYLYIHGIDVEVSFKYVIGVYGFCRGDCATTVPHEPC